jgi:hypothetical protein
MFSQVASALKRVVVIAVSILVFRNNVSITNCIGICLAMVGFYLYAIASDLQHFFPSSSPDSRDVMIGIASPVRSHAESYHSRTRLAGSFVSDAAQVLDELSMEDNNHCSLPSTKTQPKRLGF